MRNQDDICACTVANRLAWSGRSARSVSVACGKSPDWLRSVMDGRSRDPGYRSVVRLAKALGCSPDDFYDTI